MINRDKTLDITDRGLDRYEVRAHPKKRQRKRSNDHYQRSIDLFRYKMVE